VFKGLNPNSNTQEHDRRQHDCPSSVLSPSSILPPPTFHCAFFSARKRS